MNAAEQKVLKYIEDKKLIDKKDRVLVALSGGADSVFLLSLLNKYKKKLDISLSAFHMNHGLRGDFAVRDEEFCRNLCKGLSINLISISVDVRAFSSERKVSLEEGGRILRYKHMEAAAAENNFNKIATGHHSDDNAETILLNFIKGAGPRGLSGIPPQRGMIIRPLLVLSKNEILNEINLGGIATIQDETNLNTDFERNYLRNTVVPQLKEKLNPSLIETVFKTGEIFRMQADYIEKVSKRAWSKLFEVSSGSLFLKIEEFNKLHPAVAMSALKLRLDDFFSTEVPYNDVLRISRFTGLQKGRSLELAGGIICYKEKTGLFFEKRFTEVINPVIIKTGETYETAGFKITVKLTEKDAVKFGRGCEYIDAGKTSEGEFLLRPWKQGDKFFPLGMNGYKKISDFLTEQGVPSHGRKKQLVLVYKEQIVWVVGLRIDNRFKITEDTRKVLQICLK